MALSSGVARGNRRICLPTSAATSRRSAAVGGAPRSAHSPRGQPRQGAAAHRQAVVGWVLVPHLGEQQPDRAALAIEGAGQKALGARVGNGNAPLLAAAAVAARPGRGCANARLSPQAQARARLAEQPVLPPPVACRQVGARRARGCRGRCPLMLSRVRARDTRSADPSRAGARLREATSTGAVPTGDR